MPPRVEDFLPQTPEARLRLKLAQAQAKANQLDRLNAAAWQREQDRFVERRAAAAEVRRRYKPR